MFQKHVNKQDLDIFIQEFLVSKETRFVAVMDHAFFDSIDHFVKEMDELAYRKNLGMSLKVHDRGNGDTYVLLMFEKV